MCFSATASFTAGGIIASIGWAAILKNQEPSKRLFATIPMVFGIQQVSEGFVWLALQSPGHDQVLRVATYIFLTMALVVWPTMTPLSVLLMERSKKRRGALHVLLAVGIIGSLGYGIGLLTLGVTAQIGSYHILYIIDCPEQLKSAALIVYVIATILPPVVSSIRRMYVFGILVVLAYFVAWISFRGDFISVWCFFAALASMVVYRIVIDSNNVDIGLHRDVLLITQQNWN